MRMLTFYIHRAGHNLDAARRAELDRAKELLHQRVERERELKAKSKGKKTA